MMAVAAVPAAGIGKIIILEGAEVCAGSGGIACGVGAVIIIGGAAFYTGGEVYVMFAIDIGDALDKAFAEKTPDLPEDLVGEQDDKSGQSSGKTHKSGPLAPEHGGTGDSEADFGKLGGE